jgi:chromosome partitioning protein
LAGEARCAPVSNDFADAKPRAGGFAALVRPRAGSCVVVLSAPKDGAGRTTLAAHLAVAALHHGLTAGVVDLDVRDRGLTRWLRRRERAGERRADLVMPAAVAGDPLDVDAELARWPSLAAAMRAACALVVVDAPAGCDALAREAVARADRAITIVADAASEVDRLLDVDAAGRDAGRPSAYAKMIWQERLDRARADGGALDWRILRARSLGPDTVADARFEAAERRLGAHFAPALPDDPTWREGFAEGLTALDLDRASARESPAARALRDLLIALRLPGLEGAQLAL